ncbi:MAG: YhdH/YhfP family quinone oxidoreductase [Desulfuromonadales bacterium]|nr:YhdH/YhfP family quinone oxidoreductase [Desulfuromonadales bacterium]
MAARTFTALIVEKRESDSFSCTVGTRSIEDLPAGDLLIKVHYSSLNYKDALSATGQFGITKKYPHTPGIDVAGEVVECRDGSYKPGDKVIVTSYDLGMDTPGGFGQYVSVPSCWAVPLPDGLTLRESMVLGTAGLTAGLCVRKLVRNGVQPEDGEILVTGATGGVGSIAVAILAKTGYRVVAATGKASETTYLHSIGAAEVISREAVTAGGEQPLMAERWAGVVDVVGGDMLGAAIKATRYDGTVTCCGLVGSLEMPVGVLPFILRGVSLMGVDSVQCTMEPRRAVWEKLAHEWKLDNLDTIAQECTLHDLEKEIHAILQGHVRGRVVVNLLES